MIEGAESILLNLVLNYLEAILVIGVGQSNIRGYSLPKWDDMKRRKELLFL
ncbi:hypothetical protein AsAng_0001160 [Aureispira anguillae]|uniref:Uncharacterized protein n=1 Tax=Aureispira anguillae TaxID=2864201 RepID=A0A915VJY4_9BACT|nr:hypothetical protein AsAng_0001160 [Aureispira anguillae]